MADGDSVDGKATKAPSQAVIEAVADAEGVSPHALRPPTYEPLHEAIDPDSLDALFADRVDGAPRARGTVSFTYCGYAVTVDGDGSVTLERRPTSDDTRE